MYPNAGRNGNMRPPLLLTPAAAAEQFGKGQGGERAGKFRKPLPNSLRRGRRRRRHRGLLERDGGPRGAVSIPEQLLGSVAATVRRGSGDGVQIQGRGYGLDL